MLNLFDKSYFAFSAILVFALAIACIDISQKNAQLSEAEKRYASVATQLETSRAQVLASKASIEALKQASDASNARAQASQSSAAAALRTALSKPLPAAPAGCESSTAWAISLASALVSDWSTQ